MGHKKADAETENSNEQQLGRFGFSSTPQIRALLSEAVQHPQASQVGPQPLPSACYTALSTSFIHMHACLILVLQACVPVLVNCCVALAGAEGPVPATPGCRCCALEGGPACLQ